MVGLTQRAGGIGWELLFELVKIGAFLAENFTLELNQNSTFQTNVFGIPEK